MKTTQIDLEKVAKNIAIIEEKLSFFKTSKNYPLEIENKSTEKEDWVSIRIWKKTICSWDTAWILTPWKLEFHLFGAWVDTGEQSIVDNYIVTKKPL